METRNPKPETRNPIYLGLDTATPYLALALWSEEKGLLAHFADNIGRDHAKRIIVEIDKLFQTAKATPSQLAGIGVGIGPGSYTGVRVGIATAKALAKGLNVPLVGVSTLAATAYGALKDNERGIIALDARRGSVYAGVFEKKENEVQEHSPIQKTNLIALLGQYPSLTFVQDVCPDAFYIAQSARSEKTSSVEAIYL